MVSLYKYHTIWVFEYKVVMMGVFFSSPSPVLAGFPHPAIC